LTAVDGARVVVVAVEWGGRHADAALARLGPVARIGVSAHTAIRQRDVPAAEDRIARIGRAGVVVVAGRRRAGRARARLTRLVAVAHGAIGAGGAVGGGGVAAAEGGIAGVGRTHAAVVAVRGRGRGAVAALAGLEAVARVAVRARRAVPHDDVGARGRAAHV